MVEEDGLKKAMAKSPYLRRYIAELQKETSKMPRFYENLTIKELGDIRSAAINDIESANVIYRVGTGFVHINARKNAYVNVEQKLTDEQKDRLRAIKDFILEKASNEESSETVEDQERILNKLFEQSVVIGKVKSKKGGLGSLFGSGEKITVTEEEHDLMKYYIRRDIIGYGPLEPLILDQYIEDVHLIGTGRVRVSHKAFQFALETNVRFEDEVSLNDFFISMSERMGKPVSNSHPVVDGTLPDGSRINMIYSNDVSAKGSSCTIRKFTAEPISPIQLIKFGSFSPELGAYLWLCLENKMNIIICGETASGKTSTINAIMTFIDHRGKIYSVEDTPEVKPPHKAWQRCVTREAGPEESRVTMFDLLRAALRSRPDYIVVGEIRGEEARVAFQCMQTGIPVLATFHASNSTKFIQRMTGQPVNIPMSFIDNCNVLVFQSAVNVNKRYLRRVTAVEEMMGFDKEAGGMLTRTVFKWDSATDHLYFRGNNNSFILENRIAAEHGYADKKDIYIELRKRERIIAKMAELNIVGYKEVVKIFGDYYEKGENSLPFNY